MSETLIPVTMPQHYVLRTSVVEPVPSLKKKSLLLTTILIQPDRHLTTCRVLNLTNQAQFMKKGNVMATIAAASQQDEPKLTKEALGETKIADQTIFEKKIMKF
jgi:hypothetical protein